MNIDSKKRALTTEDDRLTDETSTDSTRSKVRGTVRMLRDAWRVRLGDRSIKGRDLKRILSAVGGSVPTLRAMNADGFRSLLRTTRAQAESDDLSMSQARTDSLDIEGARARRNAICAAAGRPESAAVEGYGRLDARDGEDPTERLERARRDRDERALSACTWRR